MKDKGQRKNVKQCVTWENYQIKSRLNDFKKVHLKKLMEYWSDFMPKKSLEWLTMGVFDW